MWGVRAIVGVAVALLLSGPAAGQFDRFGGGLQPPDLLEMTGHVGEPFAAETGGWDLTLEVRFSRTVYAFHLARLRILNSGRLPQSVLFDVEPYHPNFYLFGSREEVAELAAATPQNGVRITGWRRLGSRILMVTAVDVGATADAGEEPVPTP